MGCWTVCQFRWIDFKKEDWFLDMKEEDQTPQNCESSNSDEKSKDREPEDPEFRAVLNAQNRHLESLSAHLQEAVALLKDQSKSQSDNDKKTRLTLFFSVINDIKKCRSFSYLNVCSRPKNDVAKF